MLRKKDYITLQCSTNEGVDRGVGLSPLPPPYLPPPAPSSPSSLLERRALCTRKIFLFFPPSLSSSPLPPPAPSFPSSLPLFSPLPPPLLPSPSPSSPPPAPSSPPSLLPCPPPHQWRSACINDHLSRKNNYFTIPILALSFSGYVTPWPCSCDATVKVCIIWSFFNLCVGCANSHFKISIWMQTNDYLRSFTSHGYKEIYHNDRFQYYIRNWLVTSQFIVYVLPSFLRGFLKYMNLNISKYFVELLAPSRLLYAWYFK